MPSTFEPDPIIDRFQVDCTLALQDVKLVPHLPNIMSTIGLRNVQILNFYGKTKRTEATEKKFGMTARSLKEVLTALTPILIALYADEEIHIR